MIDDSLWQGIASALPSYLDRQRWYADKLRPIAAVRLIDAAQIDRPPGRIILCLIGLDYEAGESRRYFVPVTVHPDPTPEHHTITRIETARQEVWIQDAIPDDLFRSFLLGAGRGATYRGDHGVFVFDPWIVDGAPFTIDPTTRSAATTLEQSNSSIAYGQQAMAKVYRRLEVGQNVEIDMNRYLASEAGFPSVPKLIGAATYAGDDGNVPLALVQQHVGDHQDCWTALTDLLRHRDPSALDLVRNLGGITGRMHVALAAAPAQSPLHPESISTADIDQWSRQFLISARDTDWITGERIDALPDRSQQAARAFLDAHPNWDETAGGFQELAGLYKTRVHGDYHLGQVLVTSDGRVLVVDFEGEPQRPAAEREAKYSPLKDVAGMLRSLNYATSVVSSTPDAEIQGLTHWLQEWESDARTCFLDAYRNEIRSAAVPIAPSGDRAFDQVASVMEADKALYEVRYELNSRPDWAWLPLECLSRTGSLDD